MLPNACKAGRSIKRPLIFNRMNQRGQALLLHFESHSTHGLIKRKKKKKRYLLYHHPITHNFTPDLFDKLAPSWRNVRFCNQYSSFASSLLAEMIEFGSHAFDCSVNPYAKPALRTWGGINMHPHRWQREEVNLTANLHYKIYLKETEK